MATAGHRELYNSYRKKYGEEAHVVATATYPAPRILKLAIEKAGTLDTTAVAKTLENLEDEHPYGRFSFGGIKTCGAKHQISIPVFMAQFNNGKLVGLKPIKVPVP